MAGLTRSMRTSFWLFTLHFLLKESTLTSGRVDKKYEKLFLVVYLRLFFFEFFIFGGRETFVESTLLTSRRVAVMKRMRETCFWLFTS